MKIILDKYDDGRVKGCKIMCFRLTIRNVNKTFKTSVSSFVFVLD